MANRVVRIYLVVAGDDHDMDFARLELLKLLGEHDRICVNVGCASWPNTHTRRG
jgi:hypothetical protein